MNTGERVKHITEIREKLGKDIFIWLCACAIFPRLNYNLTLKIARIIEDEYSITLENNEKFEKLIEISWFSHGFIPKEYRKILLYSMDMNFSVLMRDKINDLIPEVLKREYVKHDPLFANYSNNSIAFIIKKEYWRLFKGRHYIENFIFTQAKKGFLLSYFVPNILLLIAYVSIVLASVINNLFDPMLGLSHVVKNINQDLTTIQNMSIGKDLTVSSLFSTLGFAIYIGISWYCALFATFFNIQKKNMISLILLFYFQMFVSFLPVIIGDIFGLFSFTFIQLLIMPLLGLYISFRTYPINVRFLNNFLSILYLIIIPSSLFMFFGTSGSSLAIVVFFWVSVLLNSLLSILFMSKKLCLVALQMILMLFAFFSPIIVYFYSFWGS